MPAWAEPRLLRLLAVERRCSAANWTPPAACGAAQPGLAGSTPPAFVVTPVGYSLGMVNLGRRVPRWRHASRGPLLRRPLRERKCSCERLAASHAVSSSCGPKAMARKWPLSGAPSPPTLWGA
eukprot:4812445-Alexandrium_andersonii.AAC.1